MATEIEPVADSPMDEEPDRVHTPEGDNEFAPDQPLKPLDQGLQTPRGNGKDPYKED